MFFNGSVPRLPINRSTFDLTCKSSSQLICCLFILLVGLQNVIIVVVVLAIISEGISEASKKRSSWQQSSYHRHNYIITIKKEGQNNHRKDQLCLFGYWRVGRCVGVYNNYGSKKADFIQTVEQRRNRILLRGKQAINVFFCII